jgi:hypothetical protein
MMEGRYRALSVVLLGTAAGQPACGDGQATWLWDVATQNGDSVVEPGETALITLSLLMESPEYEMDQIAIAEAVFDTLGGIGADSGQIVDWKVLNILDNLTGDQTTTDGVSLFNTTAAQIDGQGPFAEDNPVDVFEFEWAPVVAGAYTVDYETYSHGMGPGHEHMVVVAIAQEDQYDLYETWPVTEAAISFQVVPAPTAVVVAPLGLLAATRRRR